jgi:hypothetical protein
MQPISADDLRVYSTEAANPGNRRKVSVIEVTHPAAILGGGLSLVDTPGLGAVSRDASELTRRFVPRNRRRGGRRRRRSACRRR